jgi:hypothetical protein
MHGLQWDYSLILATTQELKFNIIPLNLRVEGVVRGLKGIHLADRIILTKLE